MAGAKLACTVAAVPERQPNRTLQLSCNGRSGSGYDGPCFTPSTRHLGTWPRLCCDLATTAVNTRSSDENAGRRNSEKFWGLCTPYYLSALGMPAESVPCSMTPPLVALEFRHACFKHPAERTERERTNGGLFRRKRRNCRNRSLCGASYVLQFICPMRQPCLGLKTRAGPGRLPLQHVFSILYTMAWLLGPRHTTISNSPIPFAGCRKHAGCKSPSHFGPNRHFKHIPLLIFFFSKSSCIHSLQKDPGGLYSPL